MGFFNKFKKSGQQSENLEQVLGRSKKTGRRSIVSSDAVHELGNKIIAALESPATFGEKLSATYDIIISEGHKCGGPSSNEFEGSMRALLWRLWQIIEGAGKAGEYVTTKVCAAAYGISVHAIYQLAAQHGATLDIANLWVSPDQQTFHEKAAKAYATPTIDNEAIDKVVKTLPKGWIGR